MGISGRPKKRNVKLTAYVCPETKRSIQHEAIDRQMTIGEIIEEAMNRRTTLVTTRHANNQTD